MPLSSPFASQLSTERRGEGSREREAVAVLAARKERLDLLSAHGAGEGLPGVYGLAQTLRLSESRSSIEMPEVLEERCVEDPLLTDSAADRGPLALLHVLYIVAVFRTGFANAREDAMRAAFGTLCGVEEREEEAVVMKGHAGVSRD
jgi:hypothetical protein